MQLHPSCADGATQAERGCLDFSFTGMSWTNETDETVRTYLVVDADNSGGGANVGPFSLVVQTRALDCGDGHRDGEEECDDGNFVSGDGCAACEVEDDYACTSLDPSVCTRRPDDYECGNVECNPLPTQAVNAGAGTCCTTAAACGMTYEPMYGQSCLPRDVPGTNDTECDNESAAPGLALFAPTLTGCCRPNGTCGLTAALGAGCVERTETWRAMLDGGGSFYYQGPFLADTCTP
jgi:cysteine-rich repeat protein